MNRHAIQIAVGAALLIGAFYFGSVAQRRHGDLQSLTSPPQLANDDLVWNSPAQTQTNLTIPSSSANARKTQTSEIADEAAAQGLNDQSESQVEPQQSAPVIVNPEFSRLASAQENDSSRGGSSKLLPIDLPAPMILDDGALSADSPKSITVTPRKPALGQPLLSSPDRIQIEPLAEMEDLNTNRVDPANAIKSPGISPMVPVDRLQASRLTMETDQFRIHVTRYGDTLQSLAANYFGSAAYYLDIYLANQDVLASPINLPVGIALKIPEYSDTALRDR